MSTEEKPQTEEQPSDTKTLTISYNPTTHEMQVNGPLADKAMCYAMLELARDVIVEWHKKLQSDQQRILDAVRPNLGKFDPRLVQ